MQDKSKLREKSSSDLERNNDALRNDNKCFIQKFAVSTWPTGFCHIV